MTSASSRRSGRVLSRVLPLALALGLLASGCARRPDPALAPSPPLPASWPPFFLGAWCGPRTSELAGATWCDVAHGNITLVVRPLEDTGDRALNQALLAHLDSLAAGRICAIDSVGVLSQPPRVLVRDRAVDPDEVTRAGWRDRVRDMVRAYRGHPSLAGYFLADEPARRDFARLAELARAFAEADTAHPVFVNLLALDRDTTPRAQARWRDDALWLVTHGRLPLFSFDAYPYRPDGERAIYLLTLAAAADVSRRTGVPFAPCLQFTGYQDVAPATAAQARAMGGLAVAYGACGVTWFTYRTPNPSEPVLLWRGGARAYDGGATDRTAIQATLGMEFLALANEMGRGRHTVAHFGPLPRDTAVPGEPVAGVDSVSGGPCTIAHATGARGADRWLLVNRDVTAARTLTIHWTAPMASLSIAQFDGAGVTGSFDARTRATVVTLAPGQAAVIEPVTP